MSVFFDTEIELNKIELKLGFVFSLLACKVRLVALYISNLLNNYCIFVSLGI